MRMDKPMERYMDYETDPRPSFPCGERWNDITNSLVRLKILMHTSVTIRRIRTAIRTKCFIFTFSIIMLFCLIISNVCKCSTFLLLMDCMPLYNLIWIWFVLLMYISIFKSSHLFLSRVIVTRHTL